MTTSASLVLECREVTVTYPRAETPVLRGCSFTVKRGERVALLGFNGSGKTSLLLAAAGLLRYDGEIRVCGIEPQGSTLQAARGHIGFLFSTPDEQILFPKVEDDVAFSLHRNGVTGDAALAPARQLLHALGIEHLSSLSPHQLSHGQRQRVALAGTIVTRPDILLLDEPSANLDPPGKSAIAACFQSLPSGILLATHDSEFARRVCSRYLLLADGKIVDEGEQWETVQKQWMW